MTIRWTALAVVCLLAAPAGAAIQTVINVNIDTLNGDPVPDLIVIDGSAVTPEGIKLWLQDPIEGGKFGSSRQLPASANKRFADVLTADFNGDGLKDIVAISSTSAGVMLWLQSPPPVPACPSAPCPPDFTDASAVSELPSTGSFGAVAVGDVDGDGIPDLVLASDAGANLGVKVWIGDGDGTFLLRQNLTLSSGNSAYTQMIIADITSDIIPDVLVCRSDATNGSVLAAEGIGDGSFGPLTAIGGTSGYSTNNMILADINSDLAPDLTLATANAQIRIFDQTPSGWQEVCQGGPCGGGGSRLGNASANYTAVQAGDFDNDGKLDIVASSNAGLTQVSMFVGAGGFTISTLEQQLLTGTHEALQLVDFNVDGTLDIVSADSSAPVSPTTGASARVLWNLKFDLTAPGAGACVPLRGNPPAPIITFVFKSLTNQEDVLKYRVEVDSDFTFTTVPLAAELDQTVSTMGWTAPSYAAGVDAQVTSVLPGLVAGQTYYWRVFSYARGRRSPASNTGDASVRQFTVDDAEPEAVANNQISKGGACGANPVTFSWDQVTLNTSGNPETIIYRLYRSADPSASFPLGWTLLQDNIPQNPAPSTCLDDSSSGVQYYQVRAVDLCGSEGL